MGTGGEKLLKIGEVAKPCNVTIKTLRFYEEVGIVSPAMVDKWTGYRYYDEASVEKILQVLFLKEMGFSLQEIRDLDEDSLAKKTAQIDEKIATLIKQKHSLSVISKQKGEKIMKNFVDDRNVIGKWAYVASALSKEAFKAGDFVKDEKIFWKELYFLENGQGYWVFDHWTKGLVFTFGGLVFSYEIDDGKLFLKQTKASKDSEKLDEYVLVYEKVSGKSFTKEEISRRDNTDIAFVDNKKMHGKWELVDVINFADKAAYVPNDLGEKRGMVKEITLNPNGQAILKMPNGLVEWRWTDGKMIEPAQSLVSDMSLTADGKHMIMDWKSGDYIFANIIACCFVFKKVD